MAVLSLRVDYIFNCLTLAPAESASDAFKFVHIYDKGDYRYYEATDGYMLVRFQERKNSTEVIIENGELVKQDIIGHLENPILIKVPVTYQLKPLMGGRIYPNIPKNLLNDAGTTDTNKVIIHDDSIIKKDSARSANNETIYAELARGSFPNFDRVLPQDDCCGDIDEDKVNYYLDKKHLKFIKNNLKLDITDFKSQYGELCEQNPTNKLLYKDEERTVLCMTRQPEKVTLNGKFINDCLQKVQENEAVYIFDEEIQWANVIRRHYKTVQNGDLVGYTEILKSNDTTLKKYLALKSGYKISNDYFSALQPIITRKEQEEETLRLSSNNDVVLEYFTRPSPLPKYETAAEEIARIVKENRYKRNIDTLMFLLNQLGIPMPVFETTVKDEAKEEPQDFNTSTEISDVFSEREELSAAANLKRCLQEDNLHLVFSTPTKNSPSRSINSIADFFTELYLNMLTSTNSLESFLNKMDNVFTISQMNKLISGDAYLNPDCFKYLQLKAPFVISKQKLSALNLEIIINKSNAVLIDMDMKKVNKLVKDIIKEKNAARRAKRAEKIKQLYEDNPEPFIEAARKTRHKRQNKYIKAKTICPALLMFLDFRKTRNWVYTSKSEKAEKKVYRRKVGLVKIKQTVHRTESRHDTSENNYLTHFKWSRSPIKINSKCPALKNSDFTLCPFIQNSDHIFSVNFSCCEFKNFLNFLRIEAEAAMPIYVEKIKKIHREK